MFRVHKGIAIIVLLSSGIISACQPKAVKALEGIEAYLIETSYHEQNETDQAKSLAALASVLNKLAKQHDNVNVSFTFETNRDMIVIHSIVQQNLTSAQLKKTQEKHTKQSIREKICNSGEPKGVGAYGIGTETIIRDLSGAFIAEITCPHTTADMYALRKFLTEKPYKEQNENERTNTLRIITETLNSRQKVMKIPNPKVYKTDISRDMIMAYDFDRKNRSEKEFKKYKTLYNKEFASQNETGGEFCKLGNVQGITSLGINYQSTLLDTKDRVIHNVVCRS